MGTKGPKGKKSKARSSAKAKNLGNAPLEVLAEKAIPEIPLEIHQIIVRLVAREATIIPRPTPASRGKSPRNVWKKTLSSCALACRSWHSLVLRERLNHLSLNMNNDQADNTSRLLELMEKEPLMAASVRYLFLRGTQDTSVPQGGWVNDPYRSLPWPSFTNITHLDVDIDIIASVNHPEEVMKSWPSLSRDAFQFLQEAANLATIETLNLHCDVQESFLADNAVVHEALNDICSCHLNECFYGNNFPSLKTLSLSITMRSTLAADMTKTAFTAAVKDYLPSIFGLEGRVAEHGLTTKLYANLYAKDTTAEEYNDEDEDENDIWVFYDTDENELQGETDSELEF